MSGPDADEDPDLNKALEKARDLIRKYRAEQAQNAPQT